MTEPLSLVRLSPDREAIGQWAAERRLVANADLGYVWHGALKAAFGTLAPQPYVDRLAVQSDEMLGYVQASPESIRQRLVETASDALLFKALGLSRMAANDLPSSWRPGRQLSFEARLRPVVRSRRSAQSGAIDEIDVAPYRATRDPGISREQAYLDWLAAQFDRLGGASLLGGRMHAFSRTRVVRRTHDATGRRAVQVEGPDAWIRGRLQVTDSIGFDRLLRRGIGRHRAFGFGCLLVAPLGVLE